MEQEQIAGQMEAPLLDFLCDHTFLYAQTLMVGKETGGNKAVSYFSGHIKYNKLCSGGEKKVRI